MASANTPKRHGIGDRREQAAGGEKGKVVLVVGDSFVDENWLTSRHDVYHAYNVGHGHYISNLPSTDVRVLSLCGAASIWRILHGQPNASLTGGNVPAALRPKFNLIGLSAWNPKDHDLLLCLLCPKGDDNKRANPYLLTGLEKPPVKKGKVLCPYQDWQPCESPPSFINLIKQGNDTVEHVSTNRLIRVYTGFGGDQPRLEYRFDWRLDVREDDKKGRTQADGATLTSGRSAAKENVVDEIQKRTGLAEVCAIVVADHGYGTVDPQLVKLLHGAFPKAKWYVRCKLDAVKWLEQLCDEAERPCIRLAFTDEQLMTHKYGTRRWAVGPNVIGRGALEILGDLLGLRTFRHGKPARMGRMYADNAALLFDDDTAMVATKADDNAQVANVVMAPGTPKAIRVGRSTVFFASLVYWDLMRDLTDSSVAEAADWALRNEYTWTEDCTTAWLDASPTRLGGRFDEAIYTLPISGRAPGKEVAGVCDYNTAWAEWNASSEQLGLVKPSHDSQADGDQAEEIHLWRARVGGGNYLCPGGRKRDEINELIKRLGVYQADPVRKHPFSCLFLGEPGWGKSYLAKSMAERFQFEFVSFSIAGMSSNKDLMDSLRAISSLQNEIGKSLLVFVDEIDAVIQGHSAVGLLLEPMWEGTFKTEGNVYRVQPCVWAFASTKPVSCLLGQPKGRDFMARVNGPVIELDFFRDSARERLEGAPDDVARRAIMVEIARDPENQSLRTEVVYHGVNFLNKLFGPISSVDQGVLQIFYDSFPINGVRSIEIFVSRFVNVSGGRVSVANVPKLEDYAELRRHIRPLANWLPEDTGRKVKVIAHPPR